MFNQVQSELHYRKEPPASRNEEKVDCPTAQNDSEGNEADVAQMAANEPATTAPLLVIPKSIFEPERRLRKKRSKRVFRAEPSIHRQFFGVPIGN